MLKHPLYEPIQEEFKSDRIPPDTAVSNQKWIDVPPGLHGAFGSTDVRYQRDALPECPAKAESSGIAWQGERLNFQIVLWTKNGAQNVRFSHTDLKNEKDDIIPSENIKVQFVRYTLANDMSGRVPQDKKVLQPDILDTASVLDMPGQTVRPLWISIHVPENTKPGLYKGIVQVKSDGGISLGFELNVEVIPLTLPPPSMWSFHLDLWQNPYSVARYHRVEPWSGEHWTLLEPVLRMLADAGQKCITTTIIFDPWSGQTYDSYDSMVKWIKTRSGSWKFDYSIFDAYVTFSEKCGITKQINCYTMVPWSNSIRYLDEGSGDYKDVTVLPGTREYGEIWGAFLPDFSRHLKNKGWLEKTAIAMDERALEDMQKVVRLVKESAPGLKLALAGAYHPEIKFDIHDYCFFIAQVTPILNLAVVTRDHIRERTECGLPTTFYVCCGPDKPNTFPGSPPAESAWLGWHAAAFGYSGFLRWAYNCWVEDPLLDTAHVTWTPGDCFLVYPGGRSSVRFEKLREGIQDYEKIRIVKHLAEKSGRKDLIEPLDAALRDFTYENSQTIPAADMLNRGRRALEQAARSLENKKDKKKQD